VFSCAFTKRAVEDVLDRNPSYGRRFQLCVADVDSPNGVAIQFIISARSFRPLWHASDTLGSRV